MTKPLSDELLMLAEELRPIAPWASGTAIAAASELDALRECLRLADAVISLVEKYTKHDTLVTDLHEALAAYRAARAKAGENNS